MGIRAVVARRGDAVRALAAVAMTLAPVPGLSAGAWAQTGAPIDGDISGRAAQPAYPAPQPNVPPQQEPAYPGQSAPAYQAQPVAPLADAPAGTVPCAASGGGTYHEQDLIGAATGVFGVGARDAAKVIQSILRKQGEPNGYIVGREAGGAFIGGLRYGSGTLCRKGAPPAPVSGYGSYAGGPNGAFPGAVYAGAGAPVYWTGPSIGFDFGANAARAFVLVYNLDRMDELFHRFGAGEGQAYFIGGFNVSYLRYGDVVLIPVRLGAGLRLGVNAGYMKFSAKQKWMPF